MAKPSHCHARIPLACAVLGAALVGCYGGVHEPPRRPTQPVLTGDAEADLQTIHHKPFIGTSGQYIDDATSLQFSYGGKPLTYTEYRAIVDPAWNASLDHYDELARRCHRASIPKYLGLASIVGGFAFGIWGSNIVGDNQNLQGTVFASMLGAGAASYVAGYLFFGGRACNEAGRMWDGENPWLEYAENDSMPDFAETRSELDKLTADFNARIGKGKPAVAREAAKE